MPVAAESKVEYQKLPIRSSAAVSLSISANIKIDPSATFLTTEAIILISHFPFVKV